MRKIDTPDGLFHQSKPGDPTPSTRVTDWWLNGVQAEICNVIENLGHLKLDDSDNTQLAQAIDRFFKFGYPPIVIEISGASPNPINVAWDLESDGSYFVQLSCVSEQVRASAVLVTAFDLIAFKDTSHKKWRVLQRDFSPDQKAPIQFHVSELGKISLTTTPQWGTDVGKVHLILSKRERL